MRQIFGANFAYSWGPVAWLLASEIFSPGHRSQAVSIIISCNYMMNFVVGQVTPNMLAKLKFGTYIFFAAFCLLMFLWVFFLVPETRYKTLEEMDLVFKDNTGQKDQERMRRVMADLGAGTSPNEPEMSVDQVARRSIDDEKQLGRESATERGETWSENA